MTSAEATAVVFRTATRVGEVAVVPVRPDDDAVRVHAWLTHPGAGFWGMRHLDVDGVRRYLADVVADGAQDGWLLHVDGIPAAYVETYDPARTTLVGVHDAEPGDLGMHLLVEPPDLAPRGPRAGFTSAVMAAVLRFCLDGLGAARVVVEPDVRNAAVARKNAAAGFRVLREVELPGKRASLAVCTRADLAASPLGDGVDPAPHLRPDLMARAQRHLVAKALAELAHERVLAPVGLGSPDGDGPATYEVRLDGGRVVYRFRARRYALEHWVLDEPSLERSVDGRPADLDAQELVLEVRPLLELPDSLLPTYLEEIASTLAAAAAKLHRGGPTAAELLEADLQEVEAAMTEGHPAFVANAGRLGLSLDEYRAYAPEAGGRLRLQWLAARRDRTHLALGAGLDEATHYAAELGPEERAAFAERLERRGLDPADHLYLPVHPWQWQHRVATTFAPDVARGDLVPLGPGADEYQPQQSVRTLFNRTRPDRHYVKVALAVQNMGFLRGLSPAYMRGTPAINDWVADVVRGDPTLREARFDVLRECAAIGYTGDAYHRAPAASAHRKMLAALWRESPVPRVRPGERLMTMAALLHRDPAGTAFATALVRASGRRPADWLRAYLHAYLRPVAHCLLAHEVAFMPHGENLVLVVRDHVVVGAYMKDIAEEVAYLGDGPLPPPVERVRSAVPDAERVLPVLTDVVDGFLRHLAGILVGDGVLREDAFWALVAECLDRHRDEHPDASPGVDLRVDRFAHVCLNRLQLRNTLQMVDLAGPAEQTIRVGTLASPLARVRSARRPATPAQGGPHGARGGLDSRRGRTDPARGRRRGP